MSESQEFTAGLGVVLPGHSPSGCLQAFQSMRGALEKFCSQGCASQQSLFGSRAGFLEVQPIALYSGFTILNPEKAQACLSETLTRLGERGEGQALAVIVWLNNEKDFGITTAEVLAGCEHRRWRTVIDPFASKTASSFGNALTPISQCLVNALHAFPRSFLGRDFPQARQEEMERRVVPAAPLPMPTRRF